ncbi:MAG: hypothetical protein U0529_07700 [Thermoanaerobaculia bacterium]
MTGVILATAEGAYKATVMRKSTSRRSAGALLAALAAMLLHPLAVLARVPSPAAARHGCHCPVKMACCEAGICHADDPAPGSGPSWSGCRDEAPDRAASPAPSSTFDAALLPVSDSVTGDDGTPVRSVEAARASAPARDPATPPPRRSSAAC